MRFIDESERYLPQEKFVKISKKRSVSGKPMFQRGLIKILTKFKSTNFLRLPLSSHNMEVPLLSKQLPNNVAYHLKEPFKLDLAKVADTKAERNPNLRFSSVAQNKTGHCLLINQRVKRGGSAFF